jgi:hypothetical protein
VTRRATQRSRGIARLAAASRTRSTVRSCGRPAVRCSTRSCGGGRGSRGPWRRRPGQVDHHRRADGRGPGRPGRRNTTSADRTGGSERESSFRPPRAHSLRRTFGSLAHKGARASTRSAPSSDTRARRPRSATSVRTTTWTTTRPITSRGSESNRPRAPVEGDGIECGRILHGLTTGQERHSWGCPTPACAGHDCPFQRRRAEDTLPIDSICRSG